MKPPIIIDASAWRITPRGFLIAIFSVMAFRILEMIDQNPQLLANASFMSFIGQLTTGGLLLAASAYFTREGRQEPGEKGQLDVDLTVQPQPKPDPFKIDPQAAPKPEA